MKPNTEREDLSKEQFEHNLKQQNNKRTTTWNVLVCFNPYLPFLGEEVNNTFTELKQTHQMYSGYLSRLTIRYALKL